MKAALWVLLGALAASGCWYYFDLRNPQHRLVQAQQQLYREQVKVAEQQLKSGDVEKALTQYSAAKTVNDSIQARIEHPEMAPCAGYHEKDKDGNFLLRITGPCPTGGFEPWIYNNDREIVVEVRVLTIDGVATDIVPVLTHGRGSKAEHLDGYRFRIQGNVNCKIATYLTGGMLIRMRTLE